VLIYHHERDNDYNETPLIQGGGKVFGLALRGEGKIDIGLAKRGPLLCIREGKEKSASLTK